MSNAESVFDKMFSDPVAKFDEIFNDVFKTSSESDFELGQRYAREGHSVPMFPSDEFVRGFSGGVK